MAPWFLADDTEEKMMPYPKWKIGEVGGQNLPPFGLGNIEFLRYLSVYVGVCPRRSGSGLEP